MDGGPIMNAFLDNNIPVVDLDKISELSFEKKYNFDKSVLLASFYTDKIFKCQKK